MVLFQFFSTQNFMNIFAIGTKQLGNLDFCKKPWMSPMQDSIESFH
jgi:hypothetical protein